jgi:hypothetical protein
LRKHYAKAALELRVAGLFECRDGFVALQILLTLE